MDILTTFIWQLKCRKQKQIKDPDSLYSEFSVKWWQKNMDVIDNVPQFPRLHYNLIVFVYYHTFIFILTFKYWAYPALLSRYLLRFSL